jgi:hypothetical protein
MSCCPFNTAEGRTWPEAGPSQFPVDPHTANVQKKVNNNKIYEADPTNLPTINQSSPHQGMGQEPDGRRGGLPRQVRWTSRSHARRYVAEEGHYSYRKMLNLRPIRNGEIMSTSKFTSRIHH